jgi:hypothetical protein
MCFNCNNSTCGALLLRTSWDCASWDIRASCCSHQSRYGNVFKPAYFQGLAYPEQSPSMWQGTKADGSRRKTYTCLS